MWQHSFTGPLTGQLAGRSERLESILSQDESVCALVHEYGPTLADPDFLANEMNRNRRVVQRHATLCTDAGVPHGAPALDKQIGECSRMVMFVAFSAPSCDPYEVDAQFMGVTVITEIIVKLWKKLSVDERQYLLGILAIYIWKYNEHDMCNWNVSWLGPTPQSMIDEVGLMSLTEHIIILCFCLWVFAV